MTYAVTTCVPQLGTMHKLAKGALLPTALGLNESIQQDWMSLALPAATQAEGALHAKAAGQGPLEGLPGTMNMVFDGQPC